MPTPPSATLTILQLPNVWLFQFHPAEEHPTTGVLSALQSVAGHASFQGQIDKTVTLLNRLITTRVTGAPSPGATVDDPLKSLGRLMYNQLLPASMRTALGALQPGSPLQILTNQPELPWELLHDDNNFLALKHLVARQMLVTEAPQRPTPRQPGLWRSLLIGNPTQDLIQAESEIEALAELIAATSGAAVPRILMRQRANRAAVLEHLVNGHFDLIHYSGHVQFDPAQPTAAALILANEERLTAAEIEQNLAGSPLVFLNGCESGRGSKNSGENSGLLYLGQATAGLASAVIQRGGKGFIGTFWPVFEDSSKEFALAFYRSLLQGESIGRALQQARRERAHPADPLWASYLFYGDPSTAPIDAQLAKPCPVTLLTLHLAGSELLYATHSLEEAAHRLKQAMTNARAAIERHQGQIVNLYHNRLVAVFGIPATQENDAERAIHSALALVTELTTGNAPAPGKLRDGASVDSPVYGVGLASGDLIVDPLVADHENIRYWAGRIIDEAAWLAEQAGAGEVWISDATRHLSHYRFRMVAQSKPWGGEARTIYRVVEALPAAELIWQRPGYQTPLVGRETELDELQHLWQRCRKRRAQFVDVVGEAGVGKSRLIYEFHQRLDQPVTWLIATCPSTYPAGPYWLVAQLCRSLLQIAPADDKVTIGAKIRQAISQHTPEDWKILGELLGVDFPNALAVNSSATNSAVAKISAQDAQEWQRQRVNLFEDLLKQQATDTPLILFLEDFHRADEASLELLQHIATRLENANLPILILATLRAESDWQSPWHNRRNRRELYLAGLDATEGLALLTSLLDGQPVPDEVAQLLLANAGGVRGNPFFIYELVTSLRESKTLYFGQGRWHLPASFKARQIPNSLERLLRVRLNALPETVQDILRLLAVANDICDYAVLKLAAVGSRSEAIVDVGLKTLEEKDLIYRQPERDAYSFYHALLQSVVYESLHSDERRHLHHRIGRALQQVYRDREAEVFHLLAHHYYNSVTLPGLLGGGAMRYQEAEHEDLQQAAGYLRRAGLQAMQRYAPRQAASYFQQALQVSEPLSQYFADQRSADYTGLGEAYELLGDYQQAIDAYQSAALLLREQAMSSAMRRQSADLARRMGRLYGGLNDFTQAHQQMQQALLVLGNESNDEAPETAALIHTHTGSLYYLQGAMEEAEQACQRALKLLAGRMAGVVAATALNVYGVVCEVTGQWEQAVAVYEQSCRIWTQHSQYQLAFVTDNLATLHFYRGEIAKAEEHYRRNLAFWQKMDAKDRVAGALLNLGSIEQIYGHWVVARREMRQALLLYRQMNHPKLIALSHNNLGYLALARGQLIRAQVYFQQSILVEPTAENYRGLAEAELALGNLAQAAEATERSLDLARKASLAFEEEVTLRTVGRCHHASADNGAARQALEESLTILRTLDARYEVARTLVALGLLSGEPVTEDGSRQLLAEALVIFDEIGAKAEIERVRRVLGI